MIAKLIIKLLLLYKRFLSPVFPNSCRYYPTCSSYAVEAINKYGVVKGVLKAIWRVLRCNPFSKGGVDYP
ncbi:MAG: membrane protein insertion efficiency factor YidD [Aquificae bacterium]|nr:membrane protein insertion efficiency factor YidD [Aquificota bacterium]